MAWTDFLFSPVDYTSDFLEHPLNVFGFSNTEAAEEGQKAYDEMLEQAQQAYASNAEALRKYYEDMGAKYGGDDERYRAAIEAYLNGTPAQVENFSYSGKVEDFMDPAAGMRAQNAMTAINNSAGADGSRFSSDFLNRQAAKQQALASEEWEKSYQRLMNDRTAQLQQWQANAANERANQAAIDAKQKAAVDLYGDRSGKMDEAYESYLAGLIGNTNAMTQTGMDAVSGKTNLSMNADNGLPAAGNFFLKLFGMGGGNGS